MRWSVPEQERAAEVARRGLVVLLHGRYGTEDTLNLLPAFPHWLPASAVHRVYPGVGHVVTPGQLADAAAWLRGDLPGTRREER